MAALVIVLGNPRGDLPDVVKEYQTVTGAVIARAGGQLLGRGKLAKALAGKGAHKAGVVLRFPSTAAVEQWYNDPEYQKVLPLRQQIFGDSLEIAVFEE
ncbi:MAG: DUF1330 domain-containing protein [Nevskia sp.]|jgi:uncharacterized protein (DUF1330 family)|nr:DUF1330 domain-containing protein [Nevskia sp.]